MKSLKYAGIALCSMLTMVSCSEEQIVSNNSQQIEGNYTVEVSRVLESRTWLPEEPVGGEYPTYWSTDDRIEVSSGDRKVRGKLSLYEGGNTENAKFKGLVNGAHSKLEYAVYPLPNSKGEIELTSRSYSNPNAPMIGTFGADKSRVNFENTCGMFRLVINNYPADKNLIVTGNGISGKAKPVKNGDKWDLQWTTDDKNQVTITDTPSEVGRVVFYVPVITDQVLTNQGANDIEPTTITVAVAETEASITKDLKIAKKVVSAMESSTFLTLTYIPEEDGRAAQLIEAWDGEADTSWYNETDTEFTLSKASELAGLAKLVNEKDENGERITFEGKTIKLGASINLDGELWTPVGHYSWKDSEQMYFEGTFDGQGYTISNLLVDSENAGLFECTWGATIKNLNIENAVIVGSENAGAIVACVRANANKAQAYTTIEDVTIENYTVNGEENGPLFGMMTGWAGVRVIENGETTEYTLSSELNAKLAAGGTVTLEDDFVCSRIEPLVVPEGVTVTLDLNGKTIENSVANAIQNYGTLTIAGDGTIKAEKSNVITNTGTLIVEKAKINGLGGISSTAGQVTINGGEYIASADYNEEQWNHMLYVDNTELIINDGVFDASVGGITNAMIGIDENGKVTVNGGVFKNTQEDQPDSYRYMFTYNDESAELTVNDGEFDGGWRFNFNATTNIYGGNFKIRTMHMQGHELTIYGGVFGVNSPESYVANGYKAMEKDGVYHVVPENVDGVIATADELVALGGTQISGTYMLMADLDMTGKEMKPIMLSSGEENSLTFNGNGHTIYNLTLVQDYQNGMYVAGLFNILYSGRELNINNLKLNTVNSTSDKYAAAVVAYNSTSLTINMNDVDVDGTTISAETVAALVGYTTGPVNLTDCDVSGLALTGQVEEYKVGALVGTANTATCAVTTNNCTNSTTYGDYGRVINGATWNGVMPVTTKEQLQAALNIAENGAVISLDGEITGDVTVTQKPDVKITVEGNKMKYVGVITVDGKSQRYETAGFTIKNVDFEAEGISYDAYIRLGAGDNNTRYTNQVTVSNCTFDYTGNGDVVAVKSYTGGDRNLKVENCVAGEGMHSLMQVANVEKGLEITGCEVYAKRGINLNYTPSLMMDDCTFDVKKYAVRFGVNGEEGGEEKVFEIKESKLKSACEDGDAVIIFRDNAKKATLKLIETELIGATEFAGEEKATIVTE